MGGHHDHQPSTYGRIFALGIALNLGFVVAEWVAGMMAGSLALLADAGHNLSDVLGLVLAWTAYALGRRKPCGIFTYGLGRTSILAALFNALLLIAAIGALGWEAVKRLAEPTPVATGTVMAVAGLGIAVNTATALLFLKGRKTDLNLRGAFLHMAMDALVSVGVVVAGFLVARTGWNWLDPAVSLAIGVLILAGTWSLLRDALRLILDGVPYGLEVSALRTFLEAQPGVREVHDLHVWALSTTENALSAHIVVEPTLVPDPFLARMTRELHDRFDIDHATLQLEHGDPEHPCTVKH